MDKFTPHIIGIGEFQKKASQYLKELESQEEGFLVSHNKPQAVIMSIKRYEILRQLEQDSLSEFQEVANIIKDGDQEYNQNKTIKKKSMKMFVD